MACRVDGCAHEADVSCSMQSSGACMYVCILPIIWVTVDHFWNHVHLPYVSLLSIFTLPRWVWRDQLIVGARAARRFMPPPQPCSSPTALASLASVPSTMSKWSTLRDRGYLPEIHLRMDCSIREYEYVGIGTMPPSSLGDYLP